MNALAQQSAVLFVGLRGVDRAVLASVREALARVPRLRCEACSSAAAARGLLGRAEFALILPHVTGPGDAAEAAELVAEAAHRPQPVKAVVLSEPGRPECGLPLLRAGAAEFLERPLDLHRLALLVDLLTLRARPRPAARPGQEPVARHRVEGEGFLYDPGTGLGRVMEQIHRVAAGGTTILLQGETGTGKTRLARLIHTLSPRREKRFLAVNCAALPANLIESELFGHVRGAFTGADRDRTGKFAEAAGGTLFLDEIDSLPLGVQAKLLRVVEDRVFEPVGSNASVPMTARLVAASNLALPDEVRAGRFRSDLYYRLNVVSFTLPPLREQPAVLPVLIRHFVDEFAAQSGRPAPEVTPGAMDALRAYRWPGNVRELRNAVERAVALRAGEAIEAGDLPDAVLGVDRSALTDTAEMPALPAQVAAAAAHTLADTKAEAEAVLIRSTLRMNRNNRARTAAQLGISRETLYKKLHRYGLFEVPA